MSPEGFVESSVNNARRYAALRSLLPGMCVLVLAFFATACSGESETPTNELQAGQTLDVAGVQGHVTGRVRVDGASLVQGRNAFLVDFDPNDTALTQASALMPAHGHSAPAAPTITRTQTGYRVSDVILSMPGLWDVRLDVDDAGATDRIEFSVDVP